MSKQSVKSLPIPIMKASSQRSEQSTLMNHDNLFNIEKQLESIVNGQVSDRTKYSQYKSNKNMKHEQLESTIKNNKSFCGLIDNITIEGFSSVSVTITFDNKINDNTIFNYMVITCDDDTFESALKSFNVADNTATIIISNNIDSIRSCKVKYFYSIC